MNPIRSCVFAIAGLLAAASLQTMAQAPVPAPGAAEEGKVPPKVAKKAPPKKAPTKKAPAKAPAKAEAPKQATKVYTTGPSVLRDKDGNVIPTSPDAYNVDSALPKKK